ncbi:MAG: hypothetical protein KDC46_09790, partial [Thermoleophilia bacterium]|nr:hypothetical protein [Thermoleophilia bacterium]
ACTRASARLGMLAALLLCMLTVVPRADARPPFELMGGTSLNVSAAVDAGPSDITNVGGTPHVAWRENSTVYVKKWTGAAWSSVGASVAAGEANTRPAIGSDGTNPWVAYTTGATPNLYVRQWTGAAWTLRGGSLNASGAATASDPDIAFFGTTPYVTWLENTWDIRAKYWNGSSWVNMGGDILGAGFGVDPRITVASDGTPYLVMQVWDGTNSLWQPQVRKWTGAAWTTVGGTYIPHYAGINMYDPDIASDGTNVVVTWNEVFSGTAYIIVRRWNGTTWTTLQGGLSQTQLNMNDAGHPRVAVDGTGKVYVAMYEFNNSSGSETTLYRYSSSRWTELSSGLNIDRAADACNTECLRGLTMVGSTPWVSWNEPDGTAEQVYVKRYVPTNTMVGPLTNVTISPGVGQMILSWTNPPDANLSGTKIYRSTTDGVLGSLVHTAGAAETTWTDTGLTNGTRYYYHLITFNALGDERETTYDVVDSTIGKGYYGGALASDGTKVWTFGGCSQCTVTDEIWEFDSATGSTRQIAATLPDQIYRNRAMYVPGYDKVWIFGGDNATTYLRNVMRYDPATENLTDLGNLMPGERSEGFVVYAPNTGRIYYLGGKDNSTNPTNTIYAFNPATETMVDTGAHLPKPLFLSGGAYWSLDGCIYVFGGRTTGGVNLDDIVRYCPQSGLVETLPTKLPMIRSEISIINDGDALVMIGGGTGLPYSQDVLTFRPQDSTFLKHAVKLRIPSITNTAQEASTAAGVVYATQSYPRNRKVTQINTGSVVSGVPSTPPDTPTNIAPANGSTSTDTTPTLTASAFNDVDVVNTHAASQWQVRTDAGSYAAPAYDSQNETIALTSITTPALATGMYWFRVRYRDDGGTWSGWSTETSFSIDTTAPAAPTLVSPANGSAQNANPTLTATYNDSGTPLSTGQLQFQVCTTSGCGTVLESGSSAAGIASGADGSWTPTLLTTGTKWWRARAVDAAGNTGSWSAAWSVEVVAVAAASPSTVPVGINGQVVQVTGAGFRSGATVSISGAGVSITNTSFVNSGRIDITITVAGSATTGARDVTVTNSNSSADTKTGALTIGAASISVSFSSLGYTDAARDTTAPFDMSLGTHLAGGTVSIGPAGSGQTTAGPAFRLDITSDTTVQVSSRATQMTDGSNPIPLASTEIHDASGGSWTALTSSWSTFRDLVAPGNTVVDVEYRITTPGTQAAGSYSQSIDWTVVAQP